MPLQLSQAEIDRRLAALRAHRTLGDAADALGMKLSALREWRRTNPLAMQIPFEGTKLSEDDCLATLAAFSASGGNKIQAAQALDIHIETFKHRLTTAQRRFPGWKAPATPPPASEVAAVAVAPEESAPPSAREIHNADFWRKKARALEKQVGQLEHLTEQLTGVRDVPYHIPEYLPLAGAVSERARVVIGLHWSDVHMGEVIDTGEIQGVNAFNSDICRTRLRRHIAAACDIGTRWSDGRDCEGAYFALGGDLISGDIHEELRMTNDLTSHEQVQAVVEEACGAIRELLRAFGKVHVACVPGNHGRNTPKSTAKLYSRLSYDMMIGAMVQREFARDARVTFQQDRNKDQVTPIFGRNILLTHGDKMGTGGGQGFAGPFLPIVRGTKKIQWQYASRGVQIYYTLHGHYHISGNPGKVLSNGSVPGYSEYGDDLRVGFEPPEQNLFLMHSRWGMRERMPIQLEDPVAPEKPRVRVPVGWGDEE